MRFRHKGGYLGTEVVPALHWLPALLAQLPILRVELFQEATPRIPGCYKVVDKAGSLDKLHRAWEKLKRQHPARVTITVLAEGDRDPLDSWIS